MAENINERNLSRLSDLDDYEIASGDPDVRGWKVYSADGKEIGKVHDLLVDKSRMKVRYLDIDVKEDISGVAEDHHLLVPIGAARVDEKDDLIRIASIQTETILKSPPYIGSVSRDYEDELRKTYWPDKDHPEADDRYYEDEEYDEAKFYDPRRGIRR
jgi:photosynthetic reaction center H subunit